MFERVWAKDKRLYGAFAGLFVLLVICDTAFLTNSWARLIWGIFGYLGLFAIAKFANLTWEDAGLSAKNLGRGVKYSLPIILGFSLLLLAAYFVDREAFKDPRYHHSLSTALYSSVILLPIKTVLFEELAFRGIMLALFFKATSSRKRATIFSSLAFGLWHLSTVSGVGGYKLAGSWVVPKPLIYIAVLLATTLAGVVFCELRWRSRSLAAPFLVHWFINGAATVVAALAWS